MSETVKLMSELSARVKANLAEAKRVRNEMVASLVFTNAEQLERFDASDCWRLITRLTDLRTQVVQDRDQIRQLATGEI